MTEFGSELAAVADITLVAELVAVAVAEMAAALVAVAVDWLAAVAEAELVAVAVAELAAATEAELVAGDELTSDSSSFVFSSLLQAVVLALQLLVADGRVTSVPPSTSNRIGDITPNPLWKYPHPPLNTSRTPDGSNLHIRDNSSLIHAEELYMNHQGNRDQKEKMSWWHFLLIWIFHDFACAPAQKWEKKW
jgi:hypothetical protein